MRSYELDKLLLLAIESLGSIKSIHILVSQLILLS